MATIKIILDKRRAKKNGEYPVVGRICHQKKFKDIPTNCQVSIQQWDEKTSQVKKNHPAQQQFNLRLKTLELEYACKILECHKKFPGGFSFIELRDFLFPTSTPGNTIQKFWEHEIESLIQARKYGNARNYRIAIDVLSKNCDLDVPFEKADYTFLKGVEATFLARGLKPNSVSVYLRAFRAIYNMAINKRIVDYSYYPFRAFKIRSEKTVPSVLNIDELRNYFALNLTMDHPLYKTWLLGKLIFLLGGINFIDLVQLTSENIKLGRIIYRRTKTKKLYSMVVLKPTQEILNQLMATGSYTLCGIVDEHDLNQGARTPYIIRDKLKQFNKRLEQLGILTGTRVKLRSYTFRYSVANVCKTLGYDIQLISELLGHSYGSAITSGYLENYDKARLDEMMRDIVAAVTLQLGGKR